MKKFLFFTLISSLVLCLSCGDDDTNTDPDNPENPGNETNVVEITEDIDETTTWYSDSIYLIKDYDFWLNATLTIQAGTVIKFTSNGSYMNISSSGTVVANGTSSNQIVFTSIKDDDNGGDTNEDEGATSPAAKDWGEVLVEGNGSTFNYCTFMYGGKGSYLSTLRIYDVTASITNCKFIHNHGGKSGDFYYGALAATDASPATVIANNTFYNNNLPLSIESVINIDNSNTFHNPSNQSEINNMNGIFVYSYDDFFKAVSWEETEVPFVINDNDLWIEATGSLSLAANVVLKFTPSSTLLIETGGTLNQNSTNAFTSFKDDTRLGDTNGDGDASSPADGDWEGIYDDSMTIPSPYFYTWSNIYYDSY